MAIPSNQLQNVITYQKAELAWMLNEFVMIRHANKKFKDFNSLVANLGDTVSFDLAPRKSTMAGLVVNFQESVQRVANLTCSQAANTSSAYTDQQFIFNVEDYMDRFGRAAITELGSFVEQNILLEIVSGVTVNNPQSPLVGQNINPLSGPYRFYGNGITPINSFNQLVQADANFRAFGAAKENPMAIIPTKDVPNIVNNGLSQFAQNRNNDLTDTYMFANVGRVKYYESNLLPIHTSGNVGNNAQTLTLVSTNDPTGRNVTQLTFSGATPNDLNAVFSGDLAQFNDSVPGLPNERFLTFIGHTPSTEPVQFRVLNNAQADGSGNVTVNITPALVSVPGLDANLTTPLQPGMQVSFVPSHRAGVLMSGDPFYLAMPRLPDESPYTTVRTTDPDSGCSIRHYFGSQLGQNTRGYIWDVIYGSTLIAENSMRLIFPLNQ